jgi:hypothetical protein
MWGSVIAILIPGLLSDLGSSGGIVIAIFFAVVMSWFWFGTCYTFLEGNKLLITCGPIRGKVDIMKIERVRKTKNPLSSAALSIDRLEISSSQGFWNATWYVSPKDREEFIQELKSRNPNIEFILE